MTDLAATFLTAIVIFLVIYLGFLAVVPYGG
jgi:hypothetical protein